MDHSSSYFGEDDCGETHTMSQGEGGKHGDPLMPLQFCLGQHAALAAVATELREGEKLFAYLDDLYMVCRPERVGEAHALLSRQLWEVARISLHAGKTKVWNRSGTKPLGCMEQQVAAEILTPDAVVWRGDRQLPINEQGFKVLGVPFGHPDYIRRFLEGKTDSHRRPFERIPSSLAPLDLLRCSPCKVFHQRRQPEAI